MSKEKIYNLKLNQDELIQIWAALLYIKSQHKDLKMPTTEKLIKIFTEIVNR